MEVKIVTKCLYVFSVHRISLWDPESTNLRGIGDLSKHLVPDVRSPPGSSLYSFLVLNCPSNIAEVSSHVTYLNVQGVQGNRV